MTTNKGKNGLIELPYSDPALQQQQQQQQMNVNHHLLQQSHRSLAQPLPLPHNDLHHLHHGHLDLHHIYATGGGNSNGNVNLSGLLANHNDLHCDLYTDPYEAMENEAKKVSTEQLTVSSLNVCTDVFSVGSMQACTPRMAMAIHLARQAIRRRRFTASPAIMVSLVSMISRHL